MLKEGSITMELPKRRSIRLPDYDYTQNGAYFITLCTHEQQRLFGYVEEEKMFLNDAGKMLLVWLNKLPKNTPKFL